MKFKLPKVAAKALAVGVLVSAVFGMFIDQHQPPIENSFESIRVSKSLSRNQGTFYSLGFFKFLEVISEYRNVVDRERQMFSLEYIRPRPNLYS
jgi:hypothetical protein